MKRRTQLQVKKFAKTLIEEKENGSTAEELSKKYGHSSVYINRVIKEYKKGKPKRKAVQESGQKSIPSELTEIVTAEQNRLCEIPTSEIEKPTHAAEIPRIIEIIVYTDDDLSQNLKLKIEIPDEKDQDAYDKEFQLRILKKLRWMNAGKEFNIVS